MFVEGLGNSGYLKVNLCENEAKVIDKHLFKISFKIIASFKSYTF